MENNSLLLDNIKQGAYLLLDHILQNHKIIFIVDSDTDGFTSAAILINYIWTLYPECNITYLLHDGKQHGLNDMIDKIDSSVDLVICADSASNDYDAHKILHDQGTDVLCLDHHEADEISSYACVINNQLCSYPNKSLSGAGVVYKFCQFLDSLSPVSNNLADSFLDLTALGLD
jgi:single-stranded-DNA-specific exonuclease